MKSIANFLPVPVPVLINILALFAGGFAVHLWYVGALATAKGDLSDLKAKHSTALAAERSAALTRFQAAQARSDSLQLALNDTEQRLSTKQKDIQREINRNTTGRACLDGRTVGLLNGAAAGRASAVPAPIGGPAAEDAAAATDTDIATWANTAIEQYNVCRAKLGALIDWFPPTTSTTLEHHDD